MTRDHGAPRAQRWPKGPFPEKYRWEAVTARIDTSVETVARIDAALASLGAARSSASDDPYVHLYEASAPLSEARAALGGQAHAARFVVSELEREALRARPLICVVASADPIDGVLAVGVAGPSQGIGGATLVRFLVALRSFARYDVDELGESHLGLAITPKSDDAAQRIAERVVQIVPRAEAGTDELRRAMQRGRLTLAWG